MSRLREQAELIYKLGRLLGPLQNVAEFPNSFDGFERTRIIARYAAEYRVFIAAARSFTTGELGHDYQQQWNQINSILNNLVSLDSDSVSEADFPLRIRDNTNRLIDLLCSIPVAIGSAIHDAQTPFATYCFVRDLCLTAQREIVWLDRYFDHSLFHRYLADISPTVCVTLVTWPQARTTGATDQARYRGFLDVSRDFSTERGSTGYRLLENDDFHDRWLRCDDRMFTRGGSIKDIGKGSTFTISRLDDSPPNRQAFDDAIGQGTELFGPSQTTHP